MKNTNKKYIFFIGIFFGLCIFLLPSYVSATTWYGDSFDSGYLCGDYRNECNTCDHIRWFYPNWDRGNPVSGCVDLIYVQQGKRYLFKAILDVDSAKAECVGGTHWYSSDCSGDECSVKLTKINIVTCFGSYIDDALTFSTYVSPGLYRHGECETPCTITGYSYYTSKTVCGVAARSQTIGVAVIMDIEGWADEDDDGDSEYIYGEANLNEVTVNAAEAECCVDSDCSSGGSCENYVCEYPPAGCTIGGTPYANEACNGKCQYCDVSQSTTSWSSVPSGKICASNSLVNVDDVNYCNYGEDCSIGDCSAQKWWTSCNGAGSCRAAGSSPPTGSYTETVTAGNSYVLKSDCSQTSVSTSYDCGEAGTCNTPSTCDGSMLHKGCYQGSCSSSSSYGYTDTTDDSGCDGEICSSTDYCMSCAWYTGKRCLSGSCTQGYGGASCNPYTCSGSSCTSICSKSCGAQCESNADCPGSTCQADCTCSALTPYLSLSASPTSVIADGSSTSTITATTSNTASGKVISFSTTLGTLSSSSCTTGSSGSCSVTIKSSSTGTATVAGTASGYTSGSVSVAFTGAFGFSLSVNPISGTVVQGSNIQTTLTATLTSGSTQSVSFSASGLPSGATASFSPTSCSPTCTSAMTISTLSTTPTGSYTITITGTGGGVTRTATFSLTIISGVTIIPLCDPEDDFTGTCQYLALYGDLSYLDIKWSARYSNDMEKEIRIDCYLNCPNPGTDMDTKCADYKNSTNYCSYKALTGYGFCTIVKPGYLFKGQINNVTCNFYDPSDPTITYTHYPNRTFEPIDFDVYSALNVGVTVGESFALPVNVRNFGLFAGNFTSNTSALVKPYLVSIENPIGLIENLKHNGIGEMYSKVTFLSAEKINLKVLVKSNLDLTTCSVPADCSYLGSGAECIKSKCWKGITVEIKSGMLSLPEFNWTGLLQIIIISSVVVFFSKRKL